MLSHIFIPSRKYSTNKHRSSTYYDMTQEQTSYLALYAHIYFPHLHHVKSFRFLLPPFIFVGFVPWSKKSKSVDRLY